MKQGRLSDYFAGVGVKRLRGTEVDPCVSRGHEFQGVKPFQAFLGVPTARVKLPARYVWLSDDEAPLEILATATWYDSRKKQPNREPEPRFYYPKIAEPVVRRSSDGDTLFACLSKERQISFLMCPSGSDIEQQLLWLFGLEIQGDTLNQRVIDDKVGREIGFSARYVLEQIGINPVVEDDEWLDRLIAKFGRTFPKTIIFSAFARRGVEDADVIGDPDGTLIRWIELEERLFYTFEKHLVSERIRSGFINGRHVDVASFVQFSLSVQNRRKSRAGYSLENHLEFLFSGHSLAFKRGGNTEGKKKPDFLFPGSDAYRQLNFPKEAMTLLGSKSSCKDRWRQVLSEGALIPKKHLVTLEPSISEAQTDEMKSEQLQLVIPRVLQESYRPLQKPWLMSVADFIEMVEHRQKTYAHLI